MQKHNWVYRKQQIELRDAFFSDGSSKEMFVVANSFLDTNKCSNGGQMPGFCERFSFVFFI